MKNVAKEKMSNENKQQTWADRVDSIVKHIELNGSYNNEEYLLVTQTDELGRSWDIHVIERETDMIVAYSSMKADFPGSLREFVEDYLA